jgi:hypothetical protein
MKGWKYAMLVLAAVAALFAARAAYRAHSLAEGGIALGIEQYQKVHGGRDFNAQPNAWVVRETHPYTIKGQELIRELGLLYFKRTEWTEQEVQMLKDAIATPTGPDKRYEEWTHYDNELNAYISAASLTVAERLRDGLLRDPVVGKVFVEQLRSLLKHEQSGNRLGGITIMSTTGDVVYPEVQAEIKKMLKDTDPDVVNLARNILRDLENPANVAIWRKRVEKRGF